MSENKTAKYFKYAIGEIILVVIGILIALQINNANETRKTRLKANLYASKIVNDLIKDTININNMIARTKVSKENIDNYFSFFNQGGNSLDRIIDSSNNTSASYLRYIPVNHTFLDMQASGNSNLLSEAQRNALIYLMSEQEQLIIIIEKIISRAIAQDNEKDKQLGYPEDFYLKIGKTAKESRKEQWLIHKHVRFKNNLDLYYFIAQRGNLIKEKSKEAIQILKNKFQNDKVL